MSFRQRFQSAVSEMKEFFDPSREVMPDRSFQRLGLTDAAIALISRHNYLVLTDDLTLKITLHQRGVDAINFNPHSGRQLGSLDPEAAAPPRGASL